MGINTRESADGSLNVYIGSQPLVYADQSHGLSLTTMTQDGQSRQVVTFKDSEGPIALLGGKISGLQATRNGELKDIITRMDTLASQVIWQVNRLHSQGTGLEGLSQVQGTSQVNDATAALDSQAAGLSFKPTNGSFLLTVTSGSGADAAVTQSQINVNLTGKPTDTSLNDLIGSLNAVAGVQASVDASGKLSIKSTDPNATLSFGQDSSGVLAALGVNTFFQGDSASTIAVNADVAADPSRVAAGVDGQPGDGQTAAAIANLAQAGIQQLNGMSLSQYHQQVVSDTAVWTATAQDTATSAQVVQDSLTAQWQSLSGVSTDEEAVNLIQYQRAFEGSARFITVVNELMQTLLAM